MRNRLNTMLDTLNNELITMASMCEEAIENAMKAFESHDLELADTVVDNDLHINEKERRIESLCLTIILHQQPIAHDLRMVSAALKMITDIERIGDHASDIADIVKNLKFNQFYEEQNQIKSMAEETILMLKKVINSFIDIDLETAKKTFDNDDIIDTKFTEIKNSLIAHIKTQENADDALDLFMITKYLERIGDHTCNIAGRVICALDDDYQPQQEQA